MANYEYIDETGRRQTRGFTSTIDLRSFGVRPEDFWINAVQRERCWEWAGPTYKKSSYGYIANDKGETVSAHRYAYFLTYNHDPRDLLVCHHCDHKICIRPDHLFLGTHLSNMHDFFRKRQTMNGAAPLPKDLAIIAKMLSVSPDKAKRTSEPFVDKNSLTSIKQAAFTTTPLIKLPEAAKLTGMPLSTLRKSFMRFRPGNVPPPPPHKRVGRSIYVMVDCLDEWLANLPDQKGKYPYAVFPSADKQPRKALHPDSNIRKRAENQFHTLVMVKGRRISRTFRTIEAARAWRDEVLAGDIPAGQGGS